MRLGLRSANPFVWLLTGLGILPAPLIVAFWGMESSRALIVAVRLGILDALDAEPRSAQGVADDLGYDSAGVEALLNALNGFGYLKCRSGRFSLRRNARRWLLSRSRFSMVKPFGLLDVVWDELGDMESRIRSGGVRDFHHSDRDPEFWHSYQLGLSEVGRMVAPSVARRVKTASPPKRLLDVGGGHAAYSAAFCRRHPGLSATVLDLAPAVSVGRELVAESGLQDRVEFLEGDMLTTPWGRDHDLVLLFNVLHILTPEDASRAVGMAFEALAPGGTLAILDSVHKQRDRDIDAVGGGSELLFYAINGTRSYSEERMLQWVAESGFRAIGRTTLLAMPEVLITARRPEATA